MKYMEIFNKIEPGEILLTSVEREGGFNGYDCELINKISMNIDIPVTANGGCGKPEDFHKVIESGEAAASASSIYFYTKNSYSDTKNYLSNLRNVIRQN